MRSGWFKIRSQPLIASRQSDWRDSALIEGIRKKERMYGRVRVRVVWRDWMEVSRVGRCWFGDLDGKVELLEDEDEIGAGPMPISR